jgi:hypothetical protein
MKMENGQLISAAKTILEVKGFRNNAFESCLEETIHAINKEQIFAVTTYDIDEMIMIGLPPKPKSLENASINDKTCIVGFIEQYIPYSHYDNPVIAKEICDYFSKECSVPKEAISDIINDYSKVETLKKKLKDLEIHYGVKEILNESQRIPAQKMKWREVADPDSDGSWSNLVKAVENSI